MGRICDDDAVRAIRCVTGSDVEKIQPDTVLAPVAVESGDGLSSQPTSVSSMMCRRSAAAIGELVTAPSR
jgi:hypothetical protein